MSHLDINLNHSTSVTSLFDLLPVTFGLENGIVCSSQVILSFVNYSDSPVRSLFACWQLFLGYDGRNGIFPKNREVSWKLTSPLFEGLRFSSCTQKGRPDCRSRLLPSSAVGPSSAHSPHTGDRNLEVGGWRGVRPGRVAEW